MATPITISWDYVPGSSGTRVEYKLHSSSTWIVPTSPTNPTNLNNYPLPIADGIYYDIRLTTLCSTGAPTSITLQVIRPATSCCPAGYTLSADSTYCTQTTITEAAPPTNPQNTVSESYHEYSCYGSLIYDLGYAVNGSGSFTQIPYTNSFWVNGGGFPSTAGNTVDGPLNRAGLWAPTFFDNQTVGFTICIDAPEEGVYYVGIGADDYATIKLDGNTLVQMDVSAMNAYISSHGYAGAIATPFRFWHIYPVMLTAGSHVLEMIGTNLVTVAGFGTEVYDATPSEIQAATSYADLGAKLLFSTKDYIGQPIQVGSDGFGYTCPDGYSLVLCDGPAYCTKTLTTALIPCS